MKRRVMFALIGCVCIATTARGEFLELSATEIASIQPADSQQSPRILIRWELPKELADKIIDAAVITMQLETGENTHVPLEVSVVPLTKEWSKDNTAWEAGWTKAGGDFSDSCSALTIVDERAQGAIGVNVSDVVAKQIEGTMSNFGFIVVPDSTSETTLKAISSADALKRTSAKLVIAYRERL